MFTGGNVTARVFERQIRSPPPGASVNCARRFYENLVPSFTLYDVESPDHSFRKFTDDGLFLISFSRNHQELVVYRPSWLSYSCSNGDHSSSSSSDNLPRRASRFDSFFTQLYSVSLASANELICKDFFLYLQSHHFGLFATSTAQIHDSAPSPGAVTGVPSIDKITFTLLRLDDGVILDERVFLHDFVNLAHNMGVFLYDDLLTILSLRFQRIHVLQIRDSGNLVDVRAIGYFCREDDELFIDSNSQGMTTRDKNKLQTIPGNSGDHSENGLHETQPNAENSSFLSGIKQRLLSFIFREIWNEQSDKTLRVQCLKKKFYFHFQDYVNLIIWKVQFLDRHHLLIKFGSVDGGVARNADHHPAFFAVYNMETTNIVAFYQLKYLKNKTSSFSQFVKKMLVSLPFSCQSQSPSPYFDQSLFRFDEKLISAADRHRQSTDHPIKFISRRQPQTLKFKIKPGPECGSTDGRNKKICSFLFHPHLPLAISVQQTLFMPPSVVNIHFRR
ncbi:PREDICTED: light-mediated development protein DET1 isoform X2 [Tarenaya hassleriana]|uniref:light-mediated development protein DET1 isoform X2 n=1 Tax=Tarenaya hassleriana TaxID=28532 RepID=UPI00053C7334|nr:PREDICTED: light-mediated development protein DET1 isoform X2 [Tarenaya hassleriana]